MCQVENLIFIKNVTFYSFMHFLEKSFVKNTIFKKTGLSQLDAEAVSRRTSPYRSTAERLKTAKKPHKNEEIRRFFDGFPHFKEQYYIF